MSFSPGNSPLDGSSFYTKFLDYTATAHDVLHVVAGGEIGDSKGAAVPTDEFNGLTIHYTQKDDRGVYRQVASKNDYTFDAAGSRMSADLVAPGDKVWTTDVGANSPFVRETGTSFAAPHVTGAAALLHQYAVDRIGAEVSGWHEVSLDHRVIKAVLMNSADKLKDSGNGHRLGMEKTILKKDSSDWTTSDARDVDNHLAGRAIPTDLEMGTGQVNVSRAVKQFSSGNPLDRSAARRLALRHLRRQRRLLAFPVRAARRELRLDHADLGQQGHPDR